MCLVILRVQWDGVQLCFKNNFLLLLDLKLVWFFAAFFFILFLSTAGEKWKWVVLFDFILFWFWEIYFLMQYFMNKNKIAVKITTIG